MNQQSTLKKVPEEDKNRKSAAFDSPTNPLEIGNLFNQITGLRTRLGYGKNSGEHPADEEDDPADDWKDTPPGKKNNGKGSVRSKKGKGHN